MTGWSSPSRTAARLPKTSDPHKSKKARSEDAPGLCHLHDMPFLHDSFCRKRYGRAKRSSESHPYRGIQKLFAPSDRRSRLTARFFGHKNDTAIDTIVSITVSVMVPVTGVEPVLCCQNGILSPGCLPVPPHRRIMDAAGNVQCAARRARCQCKQCIMKGAKNQLKT